jgi:hypothetical protein
VQIIKNEDSFFNEEYDKNYNKSFKNIISNNIFEEKVASQLSLGGGLVSSNYRAY